MEIPITIVRNISLPSIQSLSRDILPHSLYLAFMPETSQAVLPQDRPYLQLNEGYLAIASPDSIAEACFSIPAVRGIQAIRIVVVANHETAPLWRKVDEVSRVVEHSHSDSARKISNLIKESNLNIEATIAWENSSAAQAFARIGVKTRLGFPEDKLVRYLTQTVEIDQKSGPIVHRVRSYLHFVKKLGFDPFQPAYFAPPPRPQAPELPILAISPGSDFGDAAEWPIDRFTELAKEFSGRFDLAIVQRPDRPEPALALAKSLGKKVCSSEGPDLIDFLATCHGLIASDSSIPHLASFVGTPSLVFFGPNEPEWRRPLGKIHHVIREHVACSGCLLNNCPLDHRCMTEITSAKALAEARSLFGE
ncbi:MAG: glycosyltransferase family 9 protein [Akkermansiaceae bacterium]|nr:glycosyltransferase family 9 protein [Akkermansiaceae bacterium]